MSDLAYSTLTELAQGLRNKKFSSEELAKEYLTRIDKGNKELHAYVSVDSDSVLAQARAADARRASQPHHLHGGRASVACRHG